MLWKTCQENGILGTCLLITKGIAVYFAISSQKGAKLFCPALFFKAEKCMRRNFVLNQRQVIKMVFEIPQKVEIIINILEKLVSSGYVQRKGKQMIPTEDGVAAIRNIPDYLKSASMTAEWENDLLRMERGEIKPHDFMQGIHGLLDKMLTDLRQIPTIAAAPNHNKVSVGSCPVCGNPVHESKLSFCCADRSCKFALWKESRYLSNMRKTLDKKMAVDLLKKGRTHVKDFYSAKKDKTFAADLVMRVEEGRAQYSLEFPKTPMKTKT